MLTAEELKGQLDQLLDQLLTQDTPVEFEHKGVRFQICKLGSPHKLDRLVSRPETIVGDPEDLVHLDWSGELRLDLP